jgi:hypothetical protein
MVLTNVHRWLTKQEYARITYRAKKLGATSWQYKYLYHNVAFKYTTVSFAFRPLEFRINLISNRYVYNEDDFRTKEDVEEITKDMLATLEFVEFLKEFAKTIEEV